MPKRFPNRIELTDAEIDILRRCMKESIKYSQMKHSICTSSQDATRSLLRNHISETAKLFNKIQKEPS